MAIFIISVCPFPTAAGPFLQTGVWRGGRDDGVLKDFRMIQIEGARAYISTADGFLRCFDISNPSAPTPLGSVPNFIAIGMRNFAVSGNYVFHPAFGDGFVVYDFLNAALPKQVVAFDSDVNGGYVQSLAVEGNRVYLGRAFGVDIIDISSISHPVWLARFPTSGPARYVAVRDHLVYVAAESSFIILDALNGAAPYEVGSLSFDLNGIDHVRLHGDFAFVGGVKVDSGKRTLHVINIANPAEPVQTDELLLGIDAAIFGNNGGACSGNYAFEPTGSGLAVIDISNPGTMREVNRTTDLTGDTDIAILGRYAFIAARTAGLMAYDISDPVHPSRVGAYFPLLNFRSIAVSHNNALITDSFGRIHTLNVSNPTWPQETGFQPLPRWGDSLVTDNDKLFVPFASGFDVYETTNAPVLKYLGSSETLTNLARIAVNENWVFATSQSGLHSFDVSDVAHIVKKGEARFTNAGSVRIAGNYAYAGRYEYPHETPVSITVPFDALVAVDISDPTNLRMVSETNVFYGSSSPSGQFDLSIAPPFLYAVGIDGMRIFDLINRAHPNPRTNYYTTVGFLAAAQPGLALMAHSASIEAVDVSNPLAPVTAGTAPLLAQLSDFTLHDNLLFVLTTSGLQIFTIPPPTSPPPGPSLAVGKQGSNLIITWPDSVGSYQLYGANSLNGLWELSATAPAHVGSKFAVTNRFPTAPMQFYKLAR